MGFSRTSGWIDTSHDDVETFTVSKQIASSVLWSLILVFFLFSPLSLSFSFLHFLFLSLFAQALGTVFFVHDELPDVSQFNFVTQRFEPLTGDARVTLHGDSPTCRRTKFQQGQFGVVRRRRRGNEEEKEEYEDERR